MEEEGEAEFEDVGFEVAGQQFHHHVQRLLRLEHRLQTAEGPCLPLPAHQLQQSHLLHEATLRKYKTTLNLPFLQTLLSRKHRTATFFCCFRSSDSYTCACDPFPSRLIGS